MKPLKTSKWDYLKKSGTTTSDGKEGNTTPKTQKWNGKKTRTENLGFYKLAWSIKPHVCEECGMALKAFSPTYISHILSRGAYPGLRKDIRNVNILCLDCHQQWEFGTRGQMKIWPENEKIIETLKKDYYERQH